MSTAFSNGTEWDCWAVGWCHRCALYSTCSIVDDLLLGDGEVPAEWIPGPLALSPARYTCTKFEAES